MRRYPFPKRNQQHSQWSTGNSARSAEPEPILEIPVNVGLPESFAFAELPCAIV